MDLNIKIIEGVREFPVLYDNRGNLDERNQAWLQLAEKLKMHDIYLKIRWHSLVQAYQRDNNFKYAKQMRFVPRIIAAPTKVENWPEFIITEEDLKDDSSGTQDQEEFVFLEVEEEENKVKESKPQLIKENVNNCTEKTMKKNDIPKENLNNKIESSIEPIQEKPILDDYKVQNVTQNHQEILNEESDTSKVKQKLAAVDVNKNNEENNVESVKGSKKVAVEKPQPLASERCEDVIFGELVSAMLKRMDENKKNNIKKEIMNLLFS